MAETATVGVAGAALGVAVGYTGIGLLNAVTPTLTATIDRGAGTGPGADNLIVHLNAHIDANTVVAAPLLAITAALIAGALAAWRSSRLRPAHALTGVE